MIVKIKHFIDAHDRRPDGERVSSSVLNFGFDHGCKEDPDASLYCMFQSNDTVTGTVSHGGLVSDIFKNPKEHRFNIYMEPKFPRWAKLVGLPVSEVNMTCPMCDGVCETGILHFKIKMPACSEISQGAEGQRIVPDQVIPKEIDMIPSFNITVAVKILNDEGPVVSSNFLMYSTPWINWL